MAKVSQNRKDECKAALLKILKPGDQVTCILRHVSRSGMSRRIDFYKMGKGEPRYLSTYIADLLEYPCGGHGVVVGGCGMDMGFSVVYNLGSTLFPKGFKVKGIGRNGDKSGHDKDGGYALKCTWL